jgi:hypothetical protein
MNFRRSKRDAVGWKELATHRHNSRTSAARSRMWAADTGGTTNKVVMILRANLGRR